MQLRVEQQTNADRRMTTRRLIWLSLLAAIAGALHFIEAILAPPFPVPGLKLGLANIATVYSIAVCGAQDAFAVVLLRVTLGSVLTGSLFGSAYIIGLAGGITACAVMVCCYAKGKSPFSLAGVSVLGAVGHNLAQLLAASYLTGISGLWPFLPYLMLFAVPTGLATGIAASILAARAGKSSFGAF
jgi:heptaprenyl diphosphate synthase